jgi:hypothetical protein
MYFVSCMLVVTFSVNCRISFCFIPILDHTHATRTPSYDVKAKPNGSQGKINALLSKIASKLRKHKQNILLSENEANITTDNVNNVFASDLHNNATSNPVTLPVNGTSSVTLNSDELNKTSTLGNGEAPLNLNPMDGETMASTESPEASTESPEASTESPKLLNMTKKTDGVRNDTAGYSSTTVSLNSALVGGNSSDNSLTRSSTVVNAAENSTKVAENNTGVMEHPTSVTGNTTGVAGNATGVTTGVVGNTAGVAGNVTGVAGNTTGVAGNTTGVTAGIVGNTAGVVGNVTGVAGNTTGVTSTLTGVTEAHPGVRNEDNGGTEAPVVSPEMSARPAMTETSTTVPPASTQIRSSTATPEGAGTTKMRESTKGKAADLLKSLKGLLSNDTYAGKGKVNSTELANSTKAPSNTPKSSPSVATTVLPTVTSTTESLEDLIKGNPTMCSLVWLGMGVWSNIVFRASCLYDKRLECLSK